MMVLSENQDKYKDNFSLIFGESSIKLAHYANKNYLK